MNTSRRQFVAGALTAGSSFGIIGADTFAGTSAPVKDQRRVIPGSPYPTFSRAVTFGRLAFISGVLGQKPGTRDLVSTEFEPQARQVLENLKASIEAAGSTLPAVLKCTCFLTDANDFATFNKVYVEFFPTNPPARSTVIVKALVVPDAKVEVDCVTSLDDRPE